VVQGALAAKEVVLVATEEMEASKEEDRE